MIRPKLLAPQVTIAEDQEDYKTVTAALVLHPLYDGVKLTGHHALADGTPFDKANSVVLAFKPSIEQRARLAAGDAIYVSLLTFLRPLQPIIVTIGAEETASIYGVEVER